MDTVTAQLRVLPGSARAEAGAVWQQVEAAAGTDAPPFCGWDWTSTWLAHYGDVVPHEFVLAEARGEPVGVALITRSVVTRGPVTLRRVHLGTAGEPSGETVFVEYNGLCTPRKYRDEFAGALLRHVHRLRGWDEFCLDGFDPEHVTPFLAAEPRFAVDRRPSPTLGLDGVEDDLVASLGSRNARNAVRRSLRGLAPLATEWATGSADALRILGELELLHQRRWEARDEPGVFSSARFCAFHRDVVDLWAPSGRAVLFAVRQAGDVVGAVYCFATSGALQYYQGGFQLAEHNKLRIGHATHVLAAQAARDRGFETYEFLVGDARFKAELSNGSRTLVWAALGRRTPHAMMVTLVRRVRGTAGQVTASAPFERLAARVGGRDAMRRHTRRRSS